MRNVCEKLSEIFSGCILKTLRAVLSHPQLSRWVATARAKSEVDMSRAKLTNCVTRPNLARFKDYSKTTDSRIPYPEQSER